MMIQFPSGARPVPNWAKPGHVAAWRITDESGDMLAMGLTRSTGMVLFQAMDHAESIERCYDCPVFVEIGRIG